MAAMASATTGAIIAATIDVLIDRSNVRWGLQLRDRLKSLQSELSLVFEVLYRIDYLKEPSQDKRTWAREANEVVCSIEVLMDNLMSKTTRRFGTNFLNRHALYFTYIFLQFKFGSKVDRFLELTNDLYARSEHFNKIEVSDSSTPSTNPLSIETDVVGFEERIYDIERLLTPNDPRRYVISIEGMAGSGKTTLARLFYDKNYSRFDTSAWVSISQKHRAEGILQDIMKEVIGSDHQELKGKQSHKKALKRILQNFLREKRYLIVLDNIPVYRGWDLWDDLKDAFPDQSNGSRIMITTRGMALHADSGIVHYKMQLLSTYESQELFKYTLGKDIPQELEKLGREIMISCSGLPLAIATMGKLLSDKVASREEWERVLKELHVKEDPGPWSEISNKIHAEIPLELTSCLHYFLLFPEEFEIPARRLISLWVAEGYLLRLKKDDKFPEQRAERFLEEEEKAERFLEELIDKNLVQVTKKKQNGKVRSCRLPVALRKLSSFNTASKSSQAPQKKVWVVDHCNNIEPNETSNHIRSDMTNNATLQASYKKSLSFMSFDDREGSQPGEEIGNFLDRCISCRCFLWLRVLDLERVFRPQLPKALSKLVSMRYLGLRWTYLESLPSSISNLLELQTLDVKHTYISSLPQSVWKLQRLRHLYLSESYRSRFGPPPRGASLKDLQTLWGAFVDEKSPVKDGLDMLINLRKLGVACRRMSDKEDPMSDKEDPMSLQLKAVADWIKKLKHLQCLRLKSHDENNQPWHLHLEPLSGHKNLSSVYLLGRLNPPSVIPEFPKNLTELTLSASALTEDPMQKLGELTKLRILQLFSESYKGKNICCPEKSFPELRVLKLWKLEELEDWIVLGGALPRLRNLEIRSCAKLQKLPDGLVHVMNLKELKLSNMPWGFTEQYKKRVGVNRFIIAHVPHVSIEP